MLTTLLLAPPYFKTFLRPWHVVICSSFVFHSPFEHSLKLAKRVDYCKQYKAEGKKDMYFLTSGILVRLFLSADSPLNSQKYIGLAWIYNLTRIIFRNPDQAMIASESCLIGILEKFLWHLEFLFKSFNYNENTHWIVIHSSI